MRQRRGGGCRIYFSKSYTSWTRYIKTGSARDRPSRGTRLHKPSETGLQFVELERSYPQRALHQPPCKYGVGNKLRKAPFEGSNKLYPLVYFKTKTMRPLAEDYIGQYIRAVYDFITTEKGEISLFKGDVLRVSAAIDNNWLCGKIRNQEGSFPCSHVEKVALPAVKGSQKLFASTETFPAQQDGDLELGKGDLILGEYEIDKNWWYGRVGHREGIFPLTHVIELEIPKLIRQRSKSVHGKEVLFARALCDSVAQLDEELGFQAGDIISVIEVIDADWYIGELGVKQGMFLSSCVELLNEEIDDSFTPTKDTSETQVPPLQPVISNSEQNFDEQQEIPISELDHKGMSYTSENTKSHDSSVTPYARTLYQFVGEMSNELSFNADDIVTLIQHVDDHWIEGELDGKIGIFPSNYVEIIVNCPSMCETKPLNMLETSAKAEHQNSDNIRNSSESTLVESCSSVESPTEERYGLVRHSFQAHAKGDLELCEGDTITVLHQIDENWFKARDENGNVGICPVEFVELIAMEPDFEMTKSKSYNDIDSTCCGKDLEKNSITIHISSSDIGKSLNSRGCDILENDATSLSKQTTFPDSMKTNTTAPTKLPFKSFSVDVVSKPAIKPKPKLLPKPVIKRKPVLIKQDNIPPAVPENGFSSKLSNVTVAESVNKTSQQKGKSNDSITRSDSCHAFSQSLNVDSIASVHRASSMSTLDHTESNDSNNKAKTFGNMDCNQSLDSIIQQEIRRSSISSHDSNELPDEKKEAKLNSFHDRNLSDSAKFDTLSNSVQINFARKKSSDPDEALRMGVNQIQSSSESGILKPIKALPMRKPPPIPHRTDTTLERQPSVRKAAPPRPMGPRLAAAPSHVPLTPTMAKPVPQRAAPPAPPPPSVSVLSHSAEKPQSVNKRPTPKPQKSVVKPPQPPEARPMSMFYVNEIDLDDEDTPLVLDLKKRIQDMEKDLDNCKKSRQELLQSLETAKGEKREELEENIDFYDENINGMSDELGKLQENLKEICVAEQEDAKRKADEARKIEKEKMEKEENRHREERRQKNKETRKNVLEEIMQTEKEFLFSLQIGLTTFLNDADMPADLDVETLFGNMEEIADVSQRLLTKLEDAVSKHDFSHQLVGPCFVKLAEDMKNSYAPYCRNHDEVITLLEKYDSMPDIKEYFDKMLIKMRQQMTLFDLGALLIKPVQRVLKYPLLLRELLKVTEEEHPDKIGIQQAIQKMTNVATAINEYKRRKDLVVYKYKKESDTTFGDKLARLSLHSLRKKSSRLRERLSTNLGIALQVAQASNKKFLLQTK
ncbi:hypothetical protein ScPMuIL_016303 [Solemya velum]